MTNTNAQFTRQNGLSIDKEFHQFVETSVIPATSITTDQFWNVLASLVETAASDNTQFACGQDVQPEDLTIDVRSCTQPINASWGSLYDALYNDGIIPHTAGLKPGSNAPGSSVNMARHKRVISCSKDFLDKTFPLSEGSHRDAVSYMVYFQNLLVILADGSTTGLDRPKQYVGKNGPSDAPDSILLEHNGTHTEILFDRNGANGAADLASVDDIHLETTGRTWFDFNAATPADKCSTYKNWLAITRQQRAKTFSNRDGEPQSIECRNHTITSSAADDQCTLVCDQYGNPVPEAIIDIITAALIEVANSGTNTTRLELSFADSTDGINGDFVIELQEFLTASICPASHTDSMKAEPSVKVIAVSADTRVTPTMRTNGTTSGLRRASCSVTATIGTMQSHGYDVTRAITQ